MSHFTRKRILIVALIALPLLLALSYPRGTRPPGSGRYSAPPDGSDSCSLCW